MNWHGVASGCSQLFLWITTHAKIGENNGFPDPTETAIAVWNKFRKEQSWGESLLASIRAFRSFKKIAVKALSVVSQLLNKWTLVAENGDKFKVDFQKRRYILSLCLKGGYIIYCWRSWIGLLFISYLVQGRQANLRTPKFRITIIGNWKAFVQGKINMIDIDRKLINMTIVND